MAQSTADTADAHMAVSGPAVPAPTLVDIYLLCYVPSPLFHAHWSVFVPNVGQLSPERGTVINVRGDPFKGFAHEFERGYVPSQDPEKPPLITKLASIDGSLVARCPGQRDGPVEVGTDVAPQNELERLALQVGAPGPSLGRRASQDGRVRVEIRDCQWWTRQFVSMMIEKKMMDVNARDILDKAPQN